MKENKFVDNLSKELIDLEWEQRQFEVGIFSPSGTAKTPRQTLKTYKEWSNNMEKYMAEDVKWTKKQLFDMVSPKDIIKVFDKNTGKQVLDIPHFHFVDNSNKKQGTVTIEWDRKGGVVNFIRSIV